MPSNIAYGSTNLPTSVTSEKTTVCNDACREESDRAAATLVDEIILFVQIKRLWICKGNVHARDCVGGKATRVSD